MKILLFVLLTVFTAFTQNQTISKKFFNLYGDKGPKAALEYAFSTNEFIDAKSQNVFAMIKELESMSGKLGKYLSSELISEEKIAKSLTKNSYLVKFERQPIRIEFIFYKSNKEWSLQNFSYDDQFFKP